MTSPTAGSYVDVTATDESHNTSTQTHVIAHSSPVPDKAQEHHHAHFHDDADAEKNKGGPIFSKGTAFEHNAVPNKDSREHAVQPGECGETTAGGMPAFVDSERNGLSHVRLEEDSKTHSLSDFYRRYRLFFHLFIWLVFTGWWIAGLILHGTHDLLSSRTGWLKPFLFWLAVTLRILFFHVPITIVTRPMHWLWSKTGVRFTELCPNWLKIPLGAFVVISVIIIGAFASPESQDNSRAVINPKSECKILY